MKQKSSYLQLLFLLLMNTAPILTMQENEVGEEERVHNSGCMDNVRVLIESVCSRRHELESDERGVCCLIPTYLLRALGLHLYHAFSNEDDET